VIGIKKLICMKVGGVQAKSCEMLGEGHVMESGIVVDFKVAQVRREERLSIGVVFASLRNKEFNKF